MRRAAALVLVCVAALVAACERPADSVAELHGRTMGTTYSVKVYPPPPADIAHRLQRRIAQRLDEINRQMSTYQPDSDLMRFNHNPSTEWQAVPAAVAHLVSQAAAISAATDGMYDVTAGPLVNLWGFGNRGRRETPPAEEEIASALSRVGYHLVEVRDSPPALRKHVGGVEIDLSSIAKGWAVDELASLLDAEQLANYLVEIGGELRTRGSKGDDVPWRVAVERPVAAVREVQHLVALGDAAMATSGDYRNYFDVDGKRFAHTIDPHTGQPVHHALASVSVIAERCADADAWATALMALGEQRAPATAERLGLEALFIVRDGDGFREIESSAWRASGRG